MPYSETTYDDVDTREQVSAQRSGSDLPSPPDASATSPAHAEPSPSTAALNTAARRAGPPDGNQNATRTAIKAEKVGHTGSSLAEELTTAEGHVNADMGRVFRELAALHPDWADTDVKHGIRVPAAADAILMQLRRAYERDRVAATLLFRLKDLKGNPLTHDQQVKQREVQEQALKMVEACLRKLGLDLDLDRHSAAANPWAALDARPRTASPSPPASEATP